MPLKIKESFSFDDLMLTPKYSDIKSRSEISLSVKLPKGIEVYHPIVPSNMRTIMGFDMAKASIESKGLTKLHRFAPIEEQFELFNKLALECWSEGYLGVSVGVKPEDKDIVDRWVKAGAKIICIDIAHGDSELCVNMCTYISKIYPEV